MKNRDSLLSIARSRMHVIPPPSRFSPVSQLRRLKGCEQVAAICYRARNGGVEFLLVQTRGGHWTFPKGGVEAGLTHAQAAALEAFEEAGVHGRMEEASFTQYTRRKPTAVRRPGAKSVVKEPAVNAHLCEVRRLGPPQESDRNRTWFSAEKAKQYLRKGRTAHYGGELARVVDRALVRIGRLQDVTSAAEYVLENRHERDALQKVQFEAFASANSPASNTSYARVVRGGRVASAPLILSGYARSEILEIVPRPDANRATGATPKLKAWSPDRQISTRSAARKKIT